MDIARRYRELWEEVQNIRQKIGAHHEVTIVGVTKTQPAEVVRQAVECGIVHIGENRVQEAESKFQELSGLRFVKYLIGPLQENKANKAAVIFDSVQSLENISAAGKLDRKLAALGEKMTVLVEVRTSYEDSKFGVPEEECEEFTGEILDMKNLDLQGFMTIAPFTDNQADIRDSFIRLRKARDRMETVYRRSFPVLSMGMSADYRIAIEEGSTMIRVGSVLFGHRNY